MAFTHVLAPTDFSEPANHAPRYAVEEAVLHRARVTLLHVQPPDASTDVYYVSGAPASGVETGADVLAGGRLGTTPVSELTVVRRDSSEAALTRLRDLVPDAYRETWDVEIAVAAAATLRMAGLPEALADRLTSGH